MNSFYNNFWQVVRREALIAKGNTLVVGVSGGPDSLLLLDVLREGAAKRQLKLIVAHVNYGVRRSAVRDEQIVRDYAAHYKLPVFVKRAKARTTQNFEEWARNVRYSFFAQLAKKYQAHCIAVAHTMDDQAETVLMHLLRGAGVAGLAGMAPHEGQVIRPLLRFTKKEVLAEVKRRKVRYGIDETNRSTKLLRNRLRHQLLPQLAKHYNPQVVSALARTADNLRSLDIFLQQTAATFVAQYGRRRGTTVRFARAAWEGLPDSALYYVLPLTAAHVSGTLVKLSAAHYAQIRALFRPWKSGLRKELSKNVFITTDHDSITIKKGK